MYEFLYRSCCLVCAPAGIATPTLGTAECRLTARLVVQSNVTEQRHRLVLADPDVEAFEPPWDESETLTLFQDPVGSESKADSLASAYLDDH